MHVPGLRRPNNAGGPGAELGCQMAATRWVCERGVCGEGSWDGKFGYGYCGFLFIVGKERCDGMVYSEGSLQRASLILSADLFP